MSSKQDADWASSTITVAICLQTALVSPNISRPIALLAMVGMASYYRRRQPSRIGMILAACGAAVIAAAIACLLVKGCLR